MYKRIVLAVDLLEPMPSPKGLTQAVELAKTGGGELRLVNVQPIMPATFMEYVRSISTSSRRSGPRRRSTRFSAASICRPSARAPRPGRGESITSF